MRQSPPQLFPPHRCFGAPRACCHSRPVLGSMPLQGWLWLPRSKSELAEFACDVRHSCWSSVETDRSRYDFPPSLAVGGSHLSRRGRAVVAAKHHAGEMLSSAPQPDDSPYQRFMWRSTNNSVACPLNVGTKFVRTAQL